MPRARDAALAVCALLGVAGLGIGADTSIDPCWMLGGAVTTIVLESLAYRRPSFVRAQFERISILVGSLLLVTAGVVAGTILAPDATISFAIGALGTYVGLLVIVTMTGWSSESAT